MAKTAAQSKAEARSDVDETEDPETGDRIVGDVPDNDVEPAPRRRGRNVRSERRPDDDDPDVALDEKVEFLKDGTVRFHMNEKRYRLRRPKFGEFRDLRALLHRLRGEHADRVEDLAEEIAAAEEAEDRRRVRTLGRQLQEMDQVDVTTVWIVEAFETLSNRPLPDPETEPDEFAALPAWLIQGGVIPELLTHWAEVPKVVPGGK